MYLGLHYITAKNTALKLFTGITTHDLYVLDMLKRSNGQCHYKRLHDLLHEQGYSINYKVLTALLKRSVDNRLITRQQIAGNVVYCITADGRRLLISFEQELDSIVSAQVRKYGNGL